MNSTDKKIVSELINKYGLEKVMWMLEVDKEFLNYMKYSGSVSINSSPVTKLYCETDDSQIFTNGTTSIFYLNEKILDFDLLNQLSQQPVSTNTEEMNKYMDTANYYMGYARLSISLNDDHGLVCVKKFDQDLETISHNEFRLLRLLLKRPSIHASVQNQIIYAEGENGYAYVLTKKRNQQLLLYKK